MTQTPLNQSEKSHRIVVLRGVGFTRPLREAFSVAPAWLSSADAFGVYPVSQRGPADALCWFDLLTPAAVPVACSDRPSLGKGLRLPPRFTGSPERWCLLLLLLGQIAFPPSPWKLYVSSERRLPTLFSHGKILIASGRNLLPVHTNTETPFGVSPGQLSSYGDPTLPSKPPVPQDQLVKCDIVVVTKLNKVVGGSLKYFTSCCGKERDWPSGLRVLSANCFDLPRHIGWNQKE